MLQIQSIKENITLENIRKSNYWDLIAMLVWNHYSEEKYQDESAITITEKWYGKCIGGSSHSSEWNNFNYFIKGYVRTLMSIQIKFTRSDYITYIDITTDGNIYCHGYYTNKNEDGYPNYSTACRNINKTNWLFENNLVNIISK